MSFATLMTGGSTQNPAFGFDHAAIHQQTAFWMRQGNTQYQVDPFWFDPRSPAAGEAASIWQIKHQAAHNDMSALLPPPAGSMSYGQIMVDADLNQAGPLTWSLFVNLAWHQAVFLELSNLVS